MMRGLLLAALLAASPASPARELEVRPPPVPELQTAAGANPPFDPTEEEAIQAIIAWRDDPVLFVRQVFGAVPDEWQADALRAVARDPRVGMSACKGPGKSCLLAWVIWWWEDTRHDAQCICTSITGPNLRDNLWKELSFWHSKAPHLQRVFEVKGERILHRERPKTWWVSARTWAQGADPSQQANSLAGFHGKAVMVVLDEMGDYPDGVVVAAEAIFSNQEVADCEAKLVAAWNPTRTDGPAFRVTTRDRKRWTIVYITGDPDDPKRSPRISREWAQSMIDDWGRDNDWVRVNVLGLFPNAAEDKLLGPNDVLKAEQRDAPRAAFVEEPIVWGLDVARFGSDSSVLRKRQGPIAFKGYTFRGLDGPKLANKVSLIIQRDMLDGARRPDAIVVDVTGVGASAFDHLRLLGWSDVLIGCDFGESADDSERFMDKRAEMWWRMAKWVKTIGCLPSNSAILGGELCAPTYGFKKRGKRTAFVLESKDELRARGVGSPDDADALAMTFYSDLWMRRDFVPEAAAGAAHRHVTDA
jgi:hypothetical protein